MDYEPLGGDSAAPTPPVTTKYQKPGVSCWAEGVQKFPRRLARRCPPWLQYGFTVVPVLLWALAVFTISQYSLFALPTVDGEDATFVRCDAGLGFWKGINDACSLNGQNCLGQYPVGTQFMFKCPANCARESWAYTPTPVGLDIVYHQSMLVGGDNTYRADSYICAAALHRGIISDSYGGCGILTFKGPQSSFESQTNNSISSLGVNAEFVGSYGFEDGDFEMRGCDDKRGSIIVVSLVTLLMIGYTSVNTRLFVYSSVVIGFWTIVLAANPPWNGGTRELNAEAVSLAARRLLPLLLSMYALYELSIKGALKGMHCNLSRVLCWTVPFFVGIVENYAFGYIPIDRLTVSDLNGQAGAWLALAIIASIVLAIIVGQAWLIYRHGLFFQYLTGYVLVVPFLFVLGHLDMQTLRIHHYILALIFLPGTGFQTHYSLFYNGLLSGLFVAGIARWDFDSIIQTYEQLRRGGPEFGTGSPAFLAPDTSDGMLLRWAPLEQCAPQGVSDWNGFSLLVNDVERFRGNATSFNLTEFSAALPWASELFHVRVAVANVFNSRTGRYTMAGVWNATSDAWTSAVDGWT